MCSTELNDSIVDELVSIGESALSVKVIDVAPIDLKILAVDCMNTSHLGRPAIVGNGCVAAIVAGDDIEPGKTVCESCVVNIGTMLS